MSYGYIKYGVRFQNILSDLSKVVKFLEGHPLYERAFHAYSEVCVAMMANQQAAKELKDLLFESKGVCFDEK